MSARTKGTTSRRNRCPRRSPSPAEIVNAYLSAFIAREYGEARRYLADENFYYEDPVNRFDSADELLRYTQMVGPVIASEGIHEIEVTDLV